MSKVYLKLDESDLKCIRGGMIFYFSREIYKKKFEKNVEEFIDIENIKLNLRYNMNSNLYLFLLISYYKKCEKRGFRIYDTINSRYVKEEEVITSIITS